MEPARKTALTIVVEVPEGITLSQIADKLKLIDLEDDLLEVSVGLWYA